MRQNLFSFLFIYFSFPGLHHFGFLFFVFFLDSECETETEKDNNTEVYFSAMGAGLKPGPHTWQNSLFSFLKVYLFA